MQTYINPVLVFQSSIKRLVGISYCTVWKINDARRKPYHFFEFLDSFHHRIKSSAILLSVSQPITSELTTSSVPKTIKISIIYLQTDFISQKIRYQRVWSQYKDSTVPQKTETKFTNASSTFSSISLFKGKLSSSISHFMTFQLKSQPKKRKYLMKKIQVSSYYTFCFQNIMRIPLKFRLILSFS